MQYQRSFCFCLLLEAGFLDAASFMCAKSINTIVNFLVDCNASRHGIGIQDVYDDLMSYISHVQRETKKLLRLFRRSSRVVAYHIFLLIRGVRSVWLYDEGIFDVEVIKRVVLHLQSLRPSVYSSIAVLVSKRGNIFVIEKVGLCKRLLEYAGSYAQQDHLFWDVSPSHDKPILTNCDGLVHALFPKLFGCLKTTDEIVLEVPVWLTGVLLEYPHVYFISAHESHAFALWKNNVFFLGFSLFLAFVVCKNMLQGYPVVNYSVSMVVPAALVAFLSQYQQ